MKIWTEKKIKWRKNKENVSHNSVRSLYPCLWVHSFFIFFRANKLSKVDTTLNFFFWSSFCSKIFVSYYKLSAISFILSAPLSSLATRTAHGFVLWRKVLCSMVCVVVSTLFFCWSHHRNVELFSERDKKIQL